MIVLRNSIIIYKLRDSRNVSIGIAVLSCVIILKSVYDQQYFDLIYTSLYFRHGENNKKNFFFYFLTVLIFGCALHLCKRLCVDRSVGYHLATINEIQHDRVTRAHRWPTRPRSLTSNSSF